MQWFNDQLPMYFNTRSVIYLSLYVENRFKFGIKTDKNYDSLNPTEIITG